MDKILEALRNILPADQVNEVASAVRGYLDDSRSELETEYNGKLEEAYGQLSTEMTTAEKTAYTGYQEAYGIIADLRNRLETQREEYNRQLEESYEEAYQMILQEREKNNTLEVDMYEEYDKKLAEMKDYIVEKMDQFLQFKGAEIYEQAKRDVLNDPRMAEYKVAMDKIVEVTSNYLSEEELSFGTSHKLDETRRELDEVKGHIRLLEGRNIRLSTDNTRLNEQVRHAQDLITESRKMVTGGRKTRVITEQKERVERSRNASGRGHADTSADNVVIAEYNNGPAGEINELLVLSGVKKS